MADMARAVPDVGTWGHPVSCRCGASGWIPFPSALLIAGFTGVILALQASYTFHGTVPLYFVGTLVGKSMMLELGPMLVGLALAGRVGASMAAELGTMRVTEQVDALETLAYDPQSYLVVPRVIAGTAMFPSSLPSPLWSASSSGGSRHVVPRPFNSRVPEGIEAVVSVQGHWFGLLKSASFGFAITLIGCIVGLSTQGGAEGVGRSTTQAQVYGAAVDSHARCILGGDAAQMIAFQDLHKAFGGKQVLAGLTLEVRDGETMVIIGYSGSGKSVALKHIVGLLQPDAGDVVVDGRAVHDARASGPERPAARHRVRVSVRGAVRLDDRRGQRRHGAAPADG